MNFQFNKAINLPVCTCKGLPFGYHFKDCVYWDHAKLEESLNESKVDTNPSHEKLLEMVMEKDGIIADQKTMIAQRDREIEYRTGLWEGAVRAFNTKVAQPERAEKENAELRAKIESLEMTIYNTENSLVVENRELQAKLEAAEKTNQNWSDTAQRMEQERRRWVKDAERYRKLKTMIGRSKTVSGRITYAMRLFDDTASTIDSTIDSLPEIPHEEKAS